MRNDLDSIRPRSFARLRRYQRAMQWRLFVLDFSINSWRREPARWRNVIPLLRAAEVRVELRDALMLLIPLPLPTSWSLWRGDARSSRDRVPFARFLSPSLACPASMMRPNRSGLDTRYLLGELASMYQVARA